MRLRLSISCLLALVALAICVAGGPTSKDETAAGTSPTSAVRSNFSPGKLFDFKVYKAAFHKTYSGLLEEMVRAKYFLSRAFRAFISAIKYKHRKSTFYLAVNSRSDWTPEQLERSKNRVLESEADSGINKLEKATSSGPAEDDLPDLLPANEEEAASALKKMAESIESSSAETQNAELRDLPLEKLISTRTDSHLAANVAKGSRDKISSNNPDYQAPELPSYGLSDEQKSTNRWYLSKEEEPTSRFISTLTQQMDGVEGNHGIEASELPDEVFADLRETGCFNEPREQGECGSCYAFAGIAIFEYLYCREKKVRPQFSEQYIIDCSPYVEDALGCTGGSSFAAAEFVQNFGLEMRANYPYNARENECPYKESTSLKQTGYIRYDFEDILRLQLDFWPRHLKKSPIYASITIGRPFHEYGGGVLSTVCTKQSAHAIVIVGHGRQDGLEYWLIRNSHGTDWGEGGYGKIAKSSGCIDVDRAYLFGTNDGKEWDLDFRTNKLRKGSIIKKHAKKIMRS